MKLFSHRMAGWLWISLAFVALLFVFAPQQLPVSLYKLSLITSAAWVAYWIDRALFPYARPDSFLGKPWSIGGPMYPGTTNTLPLTKEQALAFAAAMLRRAVIVAAAMIGVALGA